MESKEDIFAGAQYISEEDDSEVICLDTIQDEVEQILLAEE